MSVFIYEFLYRGHPTQPDAWHVMLGATVDDGFGGQTMAPPRGPLTPAQAEALGYPLSSVLDGLNASLMAERDALAADKIQLEADKLQLETDKAELSLAIGEVTHSLEGMTAERDALQAQLDAMAGLDVDGVPQVISAMQGKAMLIQAGLMAQVNAFMAAEDPDTSQALNYWLNAADWHRTHTMVTAIAGQLGLTSEQVDEMFIAAKAIV